MVKPAAMIQQQHTHDILNKVNVYIYILENSHDVYNEA